MQFSSVRTLSYKTEFKTGTVQKYSLHSPHRRMNMQQRGPEGASRRVEREQRRMIAASCEFPRELI